MKLKTRIYSAADTGGGLGNTPPPAGNEAPAGSQAEGTTGADTAADGQKSPEGENLPTPEGKYSEDDFKKFQAAAEKLAQEKIAKALADFEKKSKMNEEEKAKFEQDERMAALEKKEQEIAARELKADTAALLAEKQLPATIINMVVGVDKETTAKNIDNFKNLFDAAVQEQVEKRLKGNTPKGGGNQGGDAVTDPFLLGFGKRRK